MNNRLINRLLSLILVSALLSGCQSSEEASDNSWASGNLKGSVNSVTEIRYTAVKNGQAWEKGPQTQTYLVKTYSTGGFLLSERNYFSDSNQPVGGMDYVYDNDNNLLRIESVDREGTAVGYSDILEKEGKARILRYHDYYGTGEAARLTGKVEMSWKGELLDKASSFDTEDKLLSTADYSYDENGDLTIFAIKNLGGNQRDIIMKSDYRQYDDKGNWTMAFKEYEGFPAKEFVERKYVYFD